MESQSFLFVLFLLSDELFSIYIVDVMGTIFRVLGKKGKPSTLEYPTTLWDFFIM